MKLLNWMVGLLILSAAIALPNRACAQVPFAALPWMTIERNDYSLQCPTGWKIDSSDNELKISSNQLSADSFIVYVYAFNMKVVPFKTFIQNPPVDYDAKTTITVNTKALIYKMASTQRCVACAVPINKKREQYYCIAKNKVYVLYSLASDNALGKIKSSLETILNSFKIKD